MSGKIHSIRPFIGSQDYELSRAFYRDLGFEEVFISENLSLFTLQGIAFYLQNAYVKDWVDNTMVFVEVENVAAIWDQFISNTALSTYQNAKLIPIRTLDWGKECFVQDPSGILWHFGEFK